MNLIKPRGGRDGTVTEKKTFPSKLLSVVSTMALVRARANNQKQSFIFTNYRTTFAEHLLHHSCYYSCGFLIRIMCVIHIPPRLQLPVKGKAGEENFSCLICMNYSSHFFYCDGFLLPFPFGGLFFPFQCQ
jgi:hypothetical protein